LKTPFNKTSMLAPMLKYFYITLLFCNFYLLLKPSWIWTRY
jgi:hypothetical protein